MNCKCKVNERRLTPAVFNLKQYLNGTDTMVWTVDNLLVNNGTCNLANYDAYLTLSVGGAIDEIMLVKEQVDDTLKLTWNVGKYATKLKGYIKYQIAFRSANYDTLGVISNDEYISGTYKVETWNTESFYRLFVNQYGYKIKYDFDRLRWALYNADNELIDYQTIPSVEPHCGAWGSIVVGNNEASVWYSDEAVMIISETIPADQTATANFPTILRQFQRKIDDTIMKAGNTVLTADIGEADWHTLDDVFYLDVTNILNIPKGCSASAVSLYKTIADGNYSDVVNIRYEHLTDGSIRLYSIEKVVGKIALTVKGGDDYTFVSQSIFNGDSVQSVNGQTGAINLTASDLGALTLQDVERLTIAIENNLNINLQEQINDLQEQINGLGNSGVTSINGLTGDVTLTASDLGAVTSVNNKTGEVILTIDELGGATADNIAELQEQIDSLNDNMVTETAITNLQSQIDEVKSDIDGAVAELEGI